MLTNVLPGLRELRAPLAAGYVWLLLAWMALGHTLPTSTEEKADPLERLYQLEPVISTIGLAVVASVAAYIVGSIVIDVQTDLGRRFARVAPPTRRALIRARVGKWLVFGSSTGARAAGFLPLGLILAIVANVILLVLALVRGSGDWRITGHVAAILVCLGGIWVWPRLAVVKGGANDWDEEMAAGPLSLTEAGRSMLQRWESARAGEFRQQFADRREAAEQDAEAVRRDAEAARRDAEAARRDIDDAHGRVTESAAEALYDARYVTDAKARRMRDEADQAQTALGLKAAAYEKQELLAEGLGALKEALMFDPRWVDRATQEYIVSNRDLLKTRLLDVSEPLHSDLDRPDAEATFRMALWPPLTALVIYLALEVNPFWLSALVVPVLLAWQWISLRRTANTALIGAFVAREEQLGGAEDAARTDVIKGAILIFRYRAADEALKWRETVAKIVESTDGSLVRRWDAPSEFSLGGPTPYGLSEYLLEYAMKRTLTKRGGTRHDEPGSDGKRQRPSAEPELPADP
jgi:hypothetical protein